MTDAANVTGTVLAMIPSPPVTAYARAYRRIRSSMVGVVALALPTCVVLIATMSLPEVSTGGVTVGVLGVLGALVAIGALAGSAQRRQDSRIRAWGAAHGWTHVSVLSRRERMYATLPADDGNAETIASEVMRGQHRGRTVFCYTLTWTERTRVAGKTRVVHHTRQIIAVGLPAPMATLTVQPARAGHSPHDIDMESAEFNTRFHVHCDDRRFAFALLEPRTLQRFLDTPVTRGIRTVLPSWITANGRARLSDATVRYAGTWVMAIWPGIPDAEPSQAALDLLCDLADRVPEWVTRERRRS